MKPDRVVRREKGKRFFYIHFGDDPIRFISNLSVSGNTAAHNHLVDSLINRGDIPTGSGNFHIVISMSELQVIPHDVYLAQLAEKGETWEEPIAAGPEASAFMAESRGHFSKEEEKIIHSAQYGERCNICRPICGYRCPIRTAPFSRLAFDAAVAELGNVEDAPSEEDENPFKALTAKLRELKKLLSEGDEEEE